MITTPAYFMTAGPFPECPRRGAPQLLREGSKPEDETRSGLVHESPVRGSGRAQPFVQSGRQGGRGDPRSVHVAGAHAHDTEPSQPEIRGHVHDALSRNLPIAAER